MTKPHQADLPSDQIPEADPLTLPLNDRIVASLTEMLSGLRAELAKAVADGERLRKRAGLPPRTEAEKVAKAAADREVLAAQILRVLKGEPVQKADGSEDTLAPLVVGSVLRGKQLGIAGTDERMTGVPKGFIGKGLDGLAKARRARVAKEGGSKEPPNYIGALEDE